VNPGATTTLTATIVRGGGFAGPVTVAATGAPSGVTVTGGTIDSAATTQLISVAVAAGAAAGVTNISITGSATGVTITPASYALTVAAPTPTVTLSVSPTSATVNAGTSATLTATIVRGGGFTGPVTIAATGVPTGVTVTGGTIDSAATTRSISVTVANSAAQGLSNISITGSATGVTIAPAAYGLTVAPPLADTDGDGLPDATDPDDDNDGVLDASDLFPLDPARTMAITPAFPQVSGVYQLPNYPVTRQLTWVLQQLAASSTSTADINARFSAAALAAVPATQWQTFLQNLRTASPNATVVDLIQATPTSVTALIGNPANPASGQFLTLSTGYASDLITSLGASAFPLNGSVISSADRSLTMAQVADRFMTLAPNSSVLVARITNNQCVPIEARAANTPRATASIFKVLVLGGLGRAINDGAISATQSVTLVAANRVRNSGLSPEPLGTLFPLQDMATLMMGNSDNTATDHIHQLVGRPRLEGILGTFNHANATLMTPFLSLNENFGLLQSVSLADAQAYVSGTEDFQRTYVDTVLTPLTVGSGPQLFNHTSLYLTATWQSSATDICNAYAGIRRFNDLTAGFQVMDRALSSQAAQPGVRNRWDRVWYKGGSLNNGGGNVVLTHSWLVQSDSRGTFVVVAMANTNTPAIDQFAVQSATGRMLQLVDGLGTGP
jgi:beta-lactamase class A